MRTSYGVQIKRPRDLSLILRRIASNRGQGKPYVVADLLRDCLIAYTSNHLVFSKTSAFDRNPVTTVYVRGSAAEHKFYLDSAEGQNMGLGYLLESAIVFHCGEDIEALRKKAR